MFPLWDYDAPRKGLFAEAVSLASGFLCISAIVLRSNVQIPESPLFKGVLDDF